MKFKKTLSCTQIYELYLLLPLDFESVLINFFFIFSFLKSVEFILVYGVRYGSFFFFSCCILVHLLFICLFLAALGYHCCTGFSLVVLNWGYSPAAMQGE